jgi:hypothetical protein
VASRSERVEERRAHPPRAGGPWTAGRGGLRGGSGEGGEEEEDHGGGGAAHGWIGRLDFAFPADSWGIFSARVGGRGRLADWIWLELIFGRGVTWRVVSGCVVVGVLFAGFG